MDRVQSAKTFDGRNIPKQSVGEDVDSYKRRCFDFWKDFPDIAPDWVRLELSEMGDAKFDPVLTGNAAFDAASCFAMLNHSIVKEVAQVVHRILQGEAAWTDLPDGWDKILLKSALEHQSKMQIERLKTKGTMRVERQRFGNELEILKAAQGAISVNDRITIELSPMKSAGGKRAQKVLEANNRAALAKQEENNPDALFDDIAAAPPPEIDRNIPEDTE